MQPAAGQPIPVTCRLQHWAAPADSRETGEERLNQHLQSTASLAVSSGPLQGKALLFRSEEEPMGPMLAADMGWSQLFGRPVAVEVMPGDHHEIFNPPGARMMALRVRTMLGHDKAASGVPVVAKAASAGSATMLCSSGPEVVR